MALVDRLNSLGSLAVAVALAIAEEADLGMTRPESVSIGWPIP